MRAYLITIVMHDGSRGTCRGAFASDWQAIDTMMTAPSTCQRISGELSRARRTRAALARTGRVRGRTGYQAALRL